MRLDKGETMLLGAVLLCCAAVVSSKAIQKREINPDMLLQAAKDKRPFCNAFTGCGRKRSELSMLEEAGGGAGMTDGRQPTQAEARLWEDLLTRIEDIRQRQTAPLYFRGRRSAPQEASASQTNEKAKKR